MGQRRRRAVRRRRRGGSIRSKLSAVYQFGKRHIGKAAALAALAAAAYGLHKGIPVARNAYNQVQGTVKQAQQVARQLQGHVATARNIAAEVKAVQAAPVAYVADKASAAAQAVRRKLNEQVEAHYKKVEAERAHRAAADQRAAELLAQQKINRTIELFPQLPTPAASEAANPHPYGSLAYYKQQALLERPHGSGRRRGGDVWMPRGPLEQRRLEQLALAKLARLRYPRAPEPQLSWVERERRLARPRLQLGRTPMPKGGSLRSLTRRGVAFARKHKGKLLTALALAAAAAAHRQPRGVRELERIASHLPRFEDEAARLAEEEARRADMAFMNRLDFSAAPPRPRESRFLRKKRAEWNVPTH